MLCISMRPGDYFTVDHSTVVQFDRLNGERVHLMIHAPQTIPVVRGEVLERQGGERPACVRGKSPRYVRQLPWNRAKKQALAELRQVLGRMGDSEEVQVLREKLERIFPSFPERKEGEER
ncbi:MAG: carbon storage regulator [Oscillospiraceae bacterium]|nr:carbon storage regulator [Oscillospiraceae bacterium]